MRIGLVGCVKTKRSRATAARDLYDSPLFRGRRRYVEETCDRWFILSARHGLVDPDTVLEPYEQTLTGAPVAERRRWSRSVLADLDALNLDYARTTFEIHAGAEYRAFGLVEGLDQRGAVVEVPAEHMSQGAQLAFYAHPSRHHPAPTPERPSAVPASRAGSYAGLTEFLRRQTLDSVSLTFAELERILERLLPASARRHRAWWSPGGAHTHCRSWTDAGWQVESVELNPGRVRFVRRSW